MCIDSTITSTAIAALIAVVVTTISNIIINYYNRKKNEFDKVYDTLNKMNDYFILYPYLEDKNFTNAWIKNKDKKDEKYQRYDSYCIFVFNFLDRLCNYYNFDKKKIEEFLNVSEIIRTHQSWWNNPSDAYSNVDGYSETLKNFINQYLK